MSKPGVLDRVAADLARGRVQPAIQRLSSLAAAHPTDLDLRRRLAGLHRMVGNRVEAGRWDYLTPGAATTGAATTAEVAAFERAFPSPTRRLSALRWPDWAGEVADPYARARLDALTQAAGWDDAVAAGEALADGAPPDGTPAAPDGVPPAAAPLSNEAGRVTSLRDRFTAHGRSAGGAAAGCGLLLVAVAVAMIGLAVLGAVTVTHWLLP